MKFPRLLQTSALRIALRYAALYALVLGAALAVLGWTTHRYIGSTLKSGMRSDLAHLRSTFELRGIEGVSAEIQGGFAGRKESYSLLVASDGRKLAGNLLGWPKESELDLDGEVHNAWIEDNALPMPIEDDEVYWPTIAMQFPGGERLLLGRSVEQDKGLYDLVEYLTEVLGAAILLALLMSVNIGGEILRQVDAIGRTAGGIMAGDLSQRVPTSARNDEFDALANRLNRMLDRIQQLVRGLREITDNVAHDLRSPLTRLRNRLEVTLLGPRDEAEYRQAMSRSIEDAEGLIRTFNALLGITQAESGNHQARWQKVDFHTLASDLAEFYAPLAAEKNQSLDYDGEPAAATGNRQLIAQAIGNLLENAVKYTAEGGAILLTVRSTSAGVEIVVRDNGPGIPVEERAHVLERFVRLEESRHTPGNGLGLSLVQAVAKVHQVELILSDAGPGLVVRLRFPRGTAVP